MTAAVIRTVAFAKPSQATLNKIETFLTITLAAQVVVLIVRYAF